MMPGSSRDLTGKASELVMTATWQAWKLGGGDTDVARRGKIRKLRTPLHSDGTERQRWQPWPWNWLMGP